MPLPEYFSEIKDPGIDRRKKYPLIEIIAITILAVTSFAQGWGDIERFGKAGKKRLSKFFKFEHGIPPRDVYRRVFCVLQPKEIEKCFTNWVRAIKKNVDHEVIAIDGKTVRGSFNAVNGAKPIHPVSARATANKLVFGQIKTADHGNEITAIPPLPDMIATEGRVITIDATGCRYGIAGKTIKGKADFLFSLKGNQESPRDDVKEVFDDVGFDRLENVRADMNITANKEYDVDHGRIEHRFCAVSTNVEWLIERHHNRKTIKSTGTVETMRDVNGKKTIERRYFISSPACDAEKFSKIVREHRGIENSLHYVLDVALKEDHCRIKKGEAPENMSFIRKIALTIARSDTETKSSVTGRIKQTAWSEDYLEKLLFNSPFTN